MTVTDSATPYEVEEGVYVSFAAGELMYSDKFTLNVFAPDKQMGQDAGLAQVSKVVHAGFSDDTSSAVSATNGNFSYIYGGQEVTVGITAGMTLSQLKNLINYDGDNPGGGGQHPKRRPGPAHQLSFGAYRHGYRR